MKTLQHCAHSISQSIVFCNVINIYNTHVYEPYKQDLLPDEREMFGMFLTIKGGTTFILKNGKTVHAPENSLFFVRVNDLASIISNSNHRHCINYWFMAHGITLPLNVAYSLPKVDVKAEVDFAANEIKLLQTHIDRKIQYANLKFTTRLYEWLDLCHSTADQKTVDFIEYATLYINQNIENDISVSQLSQQFGYCEKHIRTLFKSYLGISPKQYIDAVRLERASTLLITTKMSLQEITDQLCFYSVNHFINSFKKKYNITPINYRKKTNNFITPQEK